MKNNSTDLYARNVPLALRLVFHDCIGPAGCDGCLNFKFAEHEGLIFNCFWILCPSSTNKRNLPEIVLKLFSWRSKLIEANKLQSAIILDTALFVEGARE